MSSPQIVLSGVRSQTSTHDCPKCQGPAQCAMEAGKSASACWCMSLPHQPIDKDAVTDQCLCRRCLTAQ